MSRSLNALLRDRARQNDPVRIAAKRKHRKAYNLRNPQKVKAWSILNHAIERGQMNRGACEVCSAPNAQAHHEDYSQPLKVRWVCRLHHQMVTYV